MNISKTKYGKTKDGKDIDLYTLENLKGISVSIITYGGIITSFKIPDKNGKIGEITLGFDTLDRYENDNPYFGALIGRFANRIAKGKFVLSGKEYVLSSINSGINHLHGGFKGYDKVIWQAKEIREKNSSGLKLLYKSYGDGEENYPGNVQIEVKYILTEENEFIMDYFAETDKETPINLTNHTYWNLSGIGTIKNHELTLNSNFYLPVDNDLIPTGEILNVKNTPMDFTKPKIIGKDYNNVDGGYDHCFLIAKNNGSLNLAAKLYDPVSGRNMEIFTTKPAIQFYSGNFLHNLAGRKDEIYQKTDGLCLETEYYPDAVNNPHFPSCILKPGEEYKHQTIHKFFV